MKPLWHTMSPRHRGVWPWSTTGSPACAAARGCWRSWRGPSPARDLFTLFHLPGSVSPALEALPRTTSFLQRFPFLEHAYRYYLPLFPRAIRSLDLSGYSLVISSSHCVAKGVQGGPRCDASLLLPHPHALCLGSL